MATNAEGDKVWIDQNVYTFKKNPHGPYEVKLGSTPKACVLNLRKKIITNAKKCAMRTKWTPTKKWRAKEKLRQRKIAQV